jgi:hypothetical protein
MLFITSLIMLPFQKKCGNCHVTDVTMFPTTCVYCNVCCSKSMIQKLGFLCGSITTNDELVLLTIEGKWLETIVHMIESKILDLPHLELVQFLISIHIHGNFQLLTTSTLVGFQKNIRQCIPQVEISLKAKGLITLFDNYSWW